MILYLGRMNPAHGKTILHDGRMNLPFAGMVLPSGRMVLEDGRMNRDDSEMNLASAGIA